MPLLNNGKYANTAAGDFAVTVNLPPLDQQNLWLISDDITINGQQVFGGQDVFGSISVTGAINEALGQLSPFVQGVVKAAGKELLTQPQHALLGLFDWSYNRDPTNDMTGTFALGSTVDLAQALIHEPLIPGEFMLSLSASAFVVDVPEPVGVLIIAPALLVLMARRWRPARRIAKAL